MTENTPAVSKPTLAALINQMRPELARVLPNQMSPDRIARIATTMLKQTPLLARCTPDSFLGSLLTASQLGLEPGPTGEAYFLPFRNKNGDHEVQFIVGWRGLVKLARNSGQLKDIWAEVVYERDDFQYTLGLHRDMTHVPAVGERGQPTHVYAAAELRDGGRPFIVMSLSEVEAIRSRSKSANHGPWVTDWAAMAKKTAVRQLAKWLPLSAEMQAAVTMDGTVRTHVGDLIDVTPTYVDAEAEPEAAAVEAAPARRGRPPKAAPVEDFDDVLDAALEAEQP